MGDLTLFEALTGGAFDLLNWQHSGEFDQTFSKKSNARGFAQGEIDRYIMVVYLLVFFLFQYLIPFPA